MSEPLETVIERLTEHFLNRMIPEPPAIISQNFWQGRMNHVQLEAVARDVTRVIDELRTAQREQAAERWMTLGSQGINVSICYGPSGESRELLWSVTALFPSGSQMDPPFAAHSLAHAVEIAEKESVLRGWLSPATIRGETE